MIKIFTTHQEARKDLNTPKVFLSKICPFSDGELCSSYCALFKYNEVGQTVRLCRGKSFPVTQ